MTRIAAGLRPVPIIKVAAVAQPRPIMPVDPQLRSLKIDIPAQPDVLVKLSLLITDQNVNLQAVGALIAVTWRSPPPCSRRSTRRSTA